MLQPVSISPDALTEIRNILQNKGIPKDYGLRVGVRGGGCGVTFVLGFDHKKEGDIEYFVEDVRVLVQKRETLFLVGQRIEFYEGSDAKGFHFLKYDKE